MTDAAFLGTLAFAATTGLATFFAPCAYPLLPGYVGFYLGQEDADLAGALVRGAAATVGALAVLGTVGGMLVVAGQSLVSRLVFVEPVIGLALVVLGLLFLSGRGPSFHVMLPERRSSVPGFVLFGGVYAVAAAGCVVPAILALVTQSSTLPPGQAAVALGLYALTAAVPIFGVTLLAAAGSDVLRGAARHVGSVQRVAAVVMIVAGVAQVYLSLSFLGVL